MRLVAPLFLIALLVAPGWAADEPSADDAIYDQVNYRLKTDRDVGGAAIQIEVAEGVVTLTGRVRTEKIKNKAPKVAKKVKGVKSVVNKLVVGDPVLAPPGNPDEDSGNN